MRAFVRRHESGSFVVVTFGLSWLLWYLSGILGRADLRSPDWRWAVAQVGVFAPALAGLAVAACVEPERGRRALATVLLVYVPATVLAFALAAQRHASLADIGPAWTLAIAAVGIWALAWFSRAAHRPARWPGSPASSTVVGLWSVGALVVPAVLFVPCWLAVPPSPSVPADIPAVVRDLTPLAVASALAVNLVFGGALGEEPGWRGAWLPGLLRGQSPFGATLILGVAGALWHAPIDLSSGLGAAGPMALVARLVWALPVTLLFSWVTIRAGGHLLPALAFHASVNSLPDFAMRDPERYERAMALYVLLVIVFAIAVALGDRRVWRFVTDPPTQS